MKKLQELLNQSMSSLWTMELNDMLQTDSSLPVNIHSLILESMCPILSFLFDLSGSCAKNTSITTIVYGSESLSASKRTE